MRWPDSWQKEAIDAIVPYVGTDERLEIVAGDPELSVDGTLLAGHVYQGAGGELTMIWDHSGRPDVHPWHVFFGPVLEVFLLRPKRPKKLLYQHPRWDGKKGRGARLERAKLRRSASS